ncbi:UNVERIFIED_CONTAM: Squamosa promoter-binding-like protein 8 [Sesamum radiatum]|uniref:Squamosa promoter-binding-like protein 8 n=1 Tax=Sesamum radiatum TaxID=300843 RepID=A0AAW2V8M9_SESRA
MDGGTPHRSCFLPKTTLKILNPTAPFTTLTHPFRNRQFCKPRTPFRRRPPPPPPLSPQNPNSNNHFTTFYDSRAYTASASSYPHPHQAPPPSMLTLEPAAPTGFMVVPKSEPMVGGLEFNAEYNSRIGLNLGGRTYFASSEDDFVNRLYRRSRILEPGSVNSPGAKPKAVTPT